MKLTIVIPVHNHKDNILKTIEEAKNIQLDKEIIVVDNCSTDGTREILKTLSGNAVKIVYQSRNYGYGMSVVTGMNLAQGEYLFIHNPELGNDFKRVYEMLDLAEKESLDAVFEPRLLGKNFGMVIYAALVSLFCGRDFSDINGNRLYRTASLRKLDPKASNIGFNFKVTRKLCRDGFKVKEVPVGRG
ncbi:MAG: glycosyltransferase family 2 protein [Candidatus Omnitrophica bacterium]|nr:glycosyltransferase family 2 protein [Candidatus Omnitrophota bacterium]